MPQLVPNCLQPTKSTVPAQALQLWNSDLVRESAEILGQQIATESNDPDIQIRTAWTKVLSRAPTKDEAESARDTVDAITAEWRQANINRPAAEHAIGTLCLVLLNSPEFIYVD